MTYLELVNYIIQNFNDDQLNSDVTICTKDLEYFKATILFEDPKVSDVLDPDHPFFVALD